MTPDDIEAELASRLLDDGRTALDIVLAACRRHGASLAEVLGRRRFATAVLARHAAWAELYATTPLSYPEIGRLFGRDHTTVMDGVRVAMMRKAGTYVPGKLRSA